MIITLFITLLLLYLIVMVIYLRTPHGKKFLRRYFRRHVDKQKSYQPTQPWDRHHQPDETDRSKDDKQ